MKNAIVTGASGFVGRWLVRELLNQKIKVYAVVRPDSTNLKYLPIQEGLKIICCEAENYQQLPRLVGKVEDSCFFHLAWQGVAGPDRSSLPIQLDNVKVAVEAVKAAKAIGCTSFLGLGSIMELEAHEAALAEGIKLGSNYLYGEAKHFAHLATKAKSAELGLNYFWPRLTNAYGEYEYSARFINTTMRKLLKREPLEFTAGTQLYDFIYIGDAVKALRLIAEKGSSYSSYLIGSGKVKPLKSWVEQLGQTLAPDQPLFFGNIPYSGVLLEPQVFSTEALVAATGFKPEVSFEEGLIRTMNWLKKETIK